MSAPITVVGNLAYDPELSFTPNGTAVCRVTVITSDRLLDKNTNEWKDVDVTGWKVTLWGKLAEHTAASLHKGDPVIGVGKAAEASWVDKSTQEKRSQIQVTCREAFGLNLVRGTCEYTKEALRV